MHTLKIDDRLMHSVFQPIYSFSNQACIGAEVLVRGTNTQDMRQLTAYECLLKPKDLTRGQFTKKLNRMHLSNWQNRNQESNWLFLNLDFQQLGSLEELCIQDLLVDLDIDGHKIVVEIVESEIQDEDLFVNLVKNLRKAGCLIALDDFGAGHSNIDRIWKVQPDIVKLDRQVLLEASKNVRSRSVLFNLTGLIQQAGSIALLEGVETQEQALLAMDVGVDLVQGFYFAKPDREFNQFKRGEALVCEIASLLPAYQKEQKRIEINHKKAYEALFDNLHGLKSASCLEGEMLTVSNLPFVKRFYVLDRNGYQVSEEYSASGESVCSPNETILKKGKGLCWKNRCYFTKALLNPNKIFISKPYRSLIDVELCLTVSKVIQLKDGQDFVACYDVYYFDKPISSVQTSI